jgi:HD-like signal output (HDOD) protein
MVNPVITPRKPAESLCSLPVFNPVRERITRAFLSRPDPEHLAAIMTLDPAIAAELLAAANSPLYGHASQVYTNLEAIKLLGWEETERIANLAFDAQEKFKPEAQTLVRAQWGHSLACAVAASQLARFVGIPEERAFAFGMLHDIGVWGLIATSCDAYGRVLSQGSRTCLEKLGAEECIMGIDHCKAGAWLVNSWRLPPEFAEATAAHHEITGNGARKVVTLATLACRWADALGFCAGHSERVAVRDALRSAPQALMPALKAASVEIDQRCRAQMLELSREFDAETAKLFAKL